MTETNVTEKESGGKDFQLDDTKLFALNMMRLFGESSRVLTGVMERAHEQGGPYSGLSEMNEAAKIFGSVAQRWAANPGKLAQAQGKLMTDYAELWSRSMRRFMGEEVEPVIEPEPGDNRFQDDGWRDSQFFDFWKQAYLITSNWAEDLVEDTEGLDDKTQHKAEFFTQVIASALSPSNFALTNPEVFRETLASKGANFVNGMSHLAEDIQNSDSLLRIKQTDLEAFEVGKNLAITPGKIVYQNDILQLIQYTPTTDSVHEIPLLIVSPWINKFYILDLVPKKSFIRWAVEQGFTVFVISWVNPDERLSHKTFEDYMREGVMDAAQRAIEATGAPRVNALGYCVGGTLLASSLAYMAAEGDNRIGSATYLTTQVDFSKAGDLMVFIDDTQLKALEEMMAEIGYLDGARMATIFNMLRPRDLIWPYVVNNYLLGKKPFPFDLLYWNSDSTRMPAANHNFYLREFYLENKFSKGELVLGGHRLDLSKIKVPTYELAAREDHIAPASSVYTGSKMLGGDVRFVVAGSGHIAGVINPPDKVKYQYWLGEKPGIPYEEWLDKATEHAGSWWPDWAAWLAERSGERVAPRTPGEGPHKVIEDAPGTYVMARAS